MADVSLPTGPAEVWELIHDQRGKLGAVLETLDVAEWEAPSLSEGWRVRDVVAHCIQTHVVSPRGLVSDRARPGFRLHARNRRSVATYAGLPPGELLDLYRETAALTTFVPGRLTYSLVEPVIHGQDIARAIGRHMDISPRSLVTVADIAAATDPNLGGPRRCAGLTLRATDVAWMLGHGPEVAGPLASIVLAVTGRAAGLEDLAGEGLDTLRARV